MTARPLLVTGAGGFLGGHVVERLAAEGREVVALDLAFPPDAFIRHARVRCVQASVTDAEAVAKAVAGVAGVIHCAAIAHLWTRDPADFERVNLGGTETMIEAARRAGARLVHVSSFTTLVGRESRDGAVLTEADAQAPADLLGPYPRSKRRAEIAVERAAAEGLDACIVLPSAPVGPGDHRLTPPTAMIRDLAAGKTPALIDCLLNLVDVRAMAAGVIAAHDRGAPGRRYLLTGEDVAMSELAASVAAIAGVRPPRARVPLALALAAARAEAVISRLTGRPPTAPLTGVRLAARRVRFSNARAAAELGFAPPPLEAALRDAVGWLREAGHLAGRTP